MPTVYLAGPLGFSPVTKGWHDGVLIPAVRAAGWEPLDPWADPDAPAQLAAAAGDPEALRRVNERLAARNEAMIRRTDALLAILDGADVDSGTAAEIGFAAALGVPCVGLRLDVRRTGDNDGTTVNLQVEHWLADLATDVDDALVKLRHASRDDGDRPAPPGRLRG